MNYWVYKMFRIINKTDFLGSEFTEDARWTLSQSTLDTEFLPHRFPSAFTYPVPRIMVGIRKIQRRVQQGAPRVAHQVTNPTGIHEDVGSVPGLSQWVKDPVLP